MATSRKTRAPQRRMHDWYTWVRASLEKKQTFPETPEEAVNFESNDLDRMVTALSSRAHDRAWLPAGYVVVIWKGMLEPKEALYGDAKPICYIRDDGSRMWSGTEHFAGRQ